MGVMTLLLVVMDVATFLFILGLLIVVHELGHLAAAKKIGVKVEKFSLGFGWKLFSRKRHDTEYSLSAIPLGGYVKLAGDNLQEYKGKEYEYYSKSPSKRALVIFCGPFLNYVLGLLFFCLIYFLGYPTLTTKIGGVMDDFGAKAAGIMKDDRIIAIDGQRVKYWEDMQKIIQGKKEAATVKLSVLRGGQELAMVVRIKQEQFDDSVGGKRTVGLLGITPEGEIEKIRYGPLQSIGHGMERTWFLTALTYKALWRMVTGKLSMRESMAGPLVIFDFTSKAARLGIIPLLNLLATLSISLGIFNLLPLPILDGGHIVLLGLEKVRGKHLSLKAERVVTQTGFSLIIAIAVLVTYNDFVRLFGDKIAKLFK